MSTSTLPRALWRDGLRHDFARAKLGLKVLGGPLGAEPRARGEGTLEIFQMDIRSTPRGDEYLRIWPGAGDNQLEVLDVDPALRQVVLRVKEARRRFVHLVWSGGQSPERVTAEVEARGGRVIAWGRGRCWVEDWTPSHERRYLCGRDDVKLFITETEGASTIAEAHEWLKPRRVRRAEAEAPGSVSRQGEWFFVPPTPQELEALAERLASDPHAVRRAEPLGRGPSPRPHVAERVITLRPGHRFESRFASGTVRHVDHHPLVLPALRRVVPNTAYQRPKPQVARIRWID